MGDLSSLFLFTAARCADSFAASVVCGTGKIKIPRSSAWILAFCPAAVLAAASALGTVLRPLLPEELPVFLSASLLMLLGFSRFTASPASASVPEKSSEEQLSASGSFFLAMGLSSDNGAAGLGAGLAGASLAVLFFLSLFLSFTSEQLSASGSFFLAMGLSSDNGAAGLGAGLAGASLAVLFFLSLFLSFTSVRLGASGSFFLAMGLSSDNGAAGLGAGLAGASLAVLFFLSLFLSFTSVRLGVFLGRKSALALENSRQLPGSRCSLDLSRTGGLILILLGILKLL